MGNDGGSIPKRRELVKNAARAPTVSELKATALESLAHAWAHCALSGEPLDLDTVVSDWRGRLYNYEAILKRLDASLRDVAKLKVSKNGDKWVCPISMKELGPAVKAVYLVPCGHVFADVAMKEIQEQACPECGVEFSEDNIITIVAATEADKKKKKRKGDDLKEEEAKAAAKENGKSGKKEDSRISGINNSFAASLTAKVLAEQDERNKRRKLVAEAARG
ncbi:hypothetical protein CEP52_008910 [Fusarium oligoseptatum]|uniref:Uncharacterized protein n=1 Tax=Fusarium oligoseptatum TaxID=2604345 RepID=A0A428TFG9_9HYPO|nr:hypothetical protein CEP52_008910 [Fusarium oligoseptatum]